MFLDEEKVKNFRVRPSGEHHEDDIKYLVVGTASYKGFLRTLEQMTHPTPDL